jgi:hypothetical protein
VLRQLHLISKELVSSDPGSIFAEPPPKFVEAPPLVSAQAAEISNKNSQGLRVALACKPEIHSLEKLCLFE